MKLSSSSKAWITGALLATLPLTMTLVFSGENEDKLPPGLENANWTVETLSSSEAAVVGASEPEPIAEEETETASGEESARIAETNDEPPKPEASPRAESSVVKVPVFAGFEHSRFQKHDQLIAKYVAAFNENPALWAGATDRQALKITRLTAAQVKSHMIQESGGADARSRAAWRKDPLQANVPGDWSSYKKYVGLHRPRNRNEGSIEANLKAGIMILARKGFGTSGQPAANTPANRFGGWRQALERYNGRNDLTAENRPYRQVYASRILKRAAEPRVYTSIPIKRSGKKRRSRGR